MPKKSDTPKVFATAKDVTLLRDLIRDEGRITAEVVSVKDIPDFGLEEDFMVVLVKFADAYYADTVIADKKLKAGDTAKFFIVPGESFPRSEA